MKKILFLIPLLIIGGCGNPSAANRQSQQTATMADEADRQTGMPAITNFAERKLVRDIYERRDRVATTYAYVQGVDGKLTCLGLAQGYGVPYGAQFTNPEMPITGYPAVSGESTIPQPEPNGLFMPDSANATWLQLVGPDGKVDVVYVEPNVVVSPFPLRGPAVTAPCAN